VRLVVDFGSYACHRPELELSGFGCVRVRCCEATCSDPERPVASKGRRDTVAGLFLRGITDTMRVAAVPTVWSPLWWRAGRFVAIELQAGAGELRLHRLAFASTGYPLAVAAHWPDDAIAQACLRTLRMCMHETFVDCPYYEQLQYVGDTRIQALLTHVLSRDVRPAVAAVRHFAASALNPLGHPTSNHPASGGQVIPPFALIVIGMAHDLLRWRGCLDELRALMPVLRRTADILLVRDAAGRPLAPQGWNFFDGEHGCHPDGVPVGCRPGEAGACWGWLAVLACTWLGDLEAALAEPELASRWRRLAGEMSQAVHAATWDGSGWRFVAGHAERSPHAAILALLAGAAPSADLDAAADALLDPATPPCVGIMFSHYLFAVAAERGRLAAVRPLWQRWDAALAVGFTTTPESWGGTRSDCHAWGAHPLFWRLAGVAGIRPLADGFARALIAPQLLEGEVMAATVPHPDGGGIEVDLRCEAGRLIGWVRSPVAGILRWAGSETVLSAGVRYTC
jgi:alpha-L-rhamnosidase